MTVNGIPAHPLVVHAAVVLVPLAALLAAVYAVWPGRRWQTRSPAAVVSIAAAVAVQLATMTGDQLKHSLHDDSALIRTHEHWAGLLQVAMWALCGLMVLAWWALPHESPVQGRQDRQGVRSLAWPLTVLLPVASAVVLVLVVLTGDAGARAVWGHGGSSSADPHLHGVVGRGVS